MVFTESDAQNDGLIKREVGREMAKVAQSQNPQLYGYFIQVCEEIGRDPQDIFGEMAVRALNSEEYSNRIFESEVNMRELQADQIRVEDVEYVQQLTEQLGINESDEKEDPIDKLIQQRLESVSTSPLGQFNRGREGRAGAEQKAMRHMERMEKRMARMEQKMVEEGTSSGGSVDNTQSGDRQSVDDLFGDSNPETETSEVADQQEKEQNENHFETEVTHKDDEQSNNGENPSEDEIAEAMDGVVGEVEEDSGDSQEEAPMSIDIPSETSDTEERMFTSKDGEEE